MLKYLLIVLAGVLSAQSLNKEVLERSGRQFRDSIESVFERNMASTRVYFTADPADKLPVPVKLNTLSNCTETLLFEPVYTNTFDTMEYHVFRNSPGITFNDSVNFIQNNDIKGTWYRVFADSVNTVCKLVALGLDINIDFGLPLSVSYYHNGRLVLYVNDRCAEKENLTLIRLFDYNGKSLTREHCYVLSEKRIEHYFVSH